jgi:hypothetical protein
MSASLTAGTIQRHEQRMKRLSASIEAVDNGLQIALALEHRQALWRSLAMLLGMPTAAAGIVLCSFLFQFWDGMGLWYGMACLSVSALVIRPATNPVETHHLELQQRLLELVMKRQELNEELGGLYERHERELRRGPRKPIEVREEAA